MVGIGAETELNCFCQIQGFDSAFAQILPQLTRIESLRCGGIIVEWYHV